MLEFVNLIRLGGWPQGTPGCRLSGTETCASITRSGFPAVHGSNHLVIGLAYSKMLSAMTSLCYSELRVFGLLTSNILFIERQR
jgi:hypothetical protein